MWISFDNEESDYDKGVWNQKVSLYKNFSLFQKANLILRNNTLLLPKIFEIKHENENKIIELKDGCNKTILEITEKELSEAQLNKNKLEVKDSELFFIILKNMLDTS